MYLAAGTLVVFLVDAASETVEARRPGAASFFTRDEWISDVALPGFALLARQLFEEPLPKSKG